MISKIQGKGLVMQHQVNKFPKAELNSESATRPGAIMRQQIPTPDAALYDENGELHVSALREVPSDSLNAATVGANSECDEKEIETNSQIPSNRIARIHFREEQNVFVLVPLVLPSEIRVNGVPADVTVMLVEGDGIRYKGQIYRFEISESKSVRSRAIPSVKSSNNAIAEKDLGDPPNNV